MTQTRSILSISATLLMTVLGGGALAAPAVAAAPVPCKSIGLGKFNCEFYPRGDGISAGTPVLNAAGTRVGYLNYGTNWVTCQQTGRTERSGGYYNKWWAHTQANNGQIGWASAVYAKGGDNDGPFGGGVTTCTDPRVGSPPKDGGAQGGATGGAPGGATGGAPGGAPGGVTPGGPASPSLPPAELIAAFFNAKRIMGMPYPEFLRLKRSKPAPFNWKDDGCSFPGRNQLPRRLRREIGKRMRIIFDKPCQQHDFGYRNFGQPDGLQLDPRESTRLWIDRRLYSEMKRACDNQHPLLSPFRGPCHGQARLAYELIKRYGRPYFRQPA